MNNFDLENAGYHQRITISDSVRRSRPTLLSQDEINDAVDFVKEMLSMTTPGALVVISLSPIKYRSDSRYTTYKYYPFLKASGFTDEDARKCATKISKDTKAIVETVNKDFIVLINAENMVWI